MEKFFKYKTTILIFIFIALLPIYSIKAQLVFNKTDYQIDESIHLIVCNRVPATIPSNSVSLVFDKSYQLYAPISSIQIGLSYNVSAEGIDYKLYFTQLPLINLTVKNTIGDDYQSGLINIADTVGKSINSNMGIKIRGSYSRTFPKKSYHVELWMDSTGNATQNKSFLGMRSDQTWLLLAMYNEKLRLNNKLSEDLWLKIHKLYYADQEPDAHSAIRTRYVEVFLNSAYQGVYLFTENMDRKQLELKKQTVPNTGGELYKGDDWQIGTLFTGLPALPTKATQDWGGWELAYPDTTNWVNLYQFTDFVVNASDSLFKNQIATKIRQDNFVDYFIFLNMIRAEDNTGKNLFLARYNQGEPYFIAPWDLDGTWGYYYTGDTRNITNDILSNAFFDKLLAVTGDFKLQSATRWFSLRKTTLSLDTLYKSIDVDYNFLLKNGVYNRESLVWSGDLLSYGSEELDYIKNWVKDRITFLDNYFKQLAKTQPILYSFSAKAIEKTAVLNWSVNCMAVSSFDIERSTDNITWNTININPVSSNDSLPCYYSFTDNNPVPGNSYYRLKIIDKQNNNSYSPNHLLNFDLPASIYPNPVSTTLQIQGNVEKVDVYSIQGVFISGSDRSSPNTVNVNNLPTGTYIVYVTQKNGITSSHKILISR